MRQLQGHHAERLAEVLAACAAGPRSAADLLPVLFKRALDLHQTTFAMGEAIAHLHALWFAGQLQRTQQADGGFRFTATGRQKSPWRGATGFEGWGAAQSAQRPLT